MWVDRGMANGREDDSLHLQTSLDFLEVVVVLLCLCIVMCCSVVMASCFGAYMYNDIYVISMRTKLVLVRWLAQALL